MKYTVKHALITCLGLAILAMLLPWIEIGGAIGISGAQIVSTLGIAFGFLDEISALMSYAGGYLSAYTSYTPSFGQLLVTGLALLVLIAPFVMTIVSLFLSIFGNSKKIGRSILVMQVLATLIALAYLVLVILGVNNVNDVNIVSAGAGVFVFLAASLASVIVSVMILKRYSDTDPKVIKGSPSASGILCLAGEYQGMAIPMENQQTLVLGRDASCCSLVLSGAKISRKHCEITYDANRGIYRVIDLSTNGTFIKGGSRLEKDRLNELLPGTVLNLGNELNSFRLQ